MRFSYLALLPAVLAIPATIRSSAPKPVYWLLAGDSTTAPGGGWGDAFLSTTVAPSSTGHNWAKSGATTKSFRDGGYWASVLDGIKKYKDDYRVYVTIQVHTAPIHTQDTRMTSLTFASLATTTKKQTRALPSRNMQQISRPWPKKSRLQAQLRFS
jgi:hypothetical protein